MIAQFKLIVSKVEARFTALFALELRATSTPFKKARPGLAQIKKRLVRSILRDLPCPGELLAPDFVELLLEL